MNYQTYELEDFVIDRSFQDYVLERDPSAIQFWKTWLLEHPDKFELVEEARKYILALETTRLEKPQVEIQQNWKKLQQKIGENQPVQSSRKVRPMRRFLPVAAAIAGLLLIIAGYQAFDSYRYRTLSYTTQFGQTKSLTLSDGSSIMLNANSQISYKANWKKDEDRIVHLKGEAYFDVEKQFSEGGEKVPFRILSDDLTVEVLGTTFNINNREGRGKVVLNTGKIQLSHDKHAETIIMEPGEMVEIDQKMRKTAVSPRKYISWTENLLVLDETSVQEIAQMITDNYGYDVQIKGGKLSERTLTGEIVVMELQDLLDVLNTSFDLQIIKQDNSLTFQAAP